MPGTLTEREAADVRARLGGPGRHAGLSGWARVVLAEICAGTRVPPVIEHPLGFICVQLYRGDGWGLCLHIWTPRETPVALTTSPVHSHSWDLSSQVICGLLENVQ